MRRSLKVAVFGACLVCGCAEAPPASVPDGPPIPDVEPWVVEPNAVLSVGVLDGDPNYQFVDVTAAVRQADGDLVVADAGAHNVRIFAPDGTFKALVGGAGQGPGEFQSPSQLFVGQRDSIFVWDREAWRLSVYDQDGTLSAVNGYPLAQIAKAATPPLYPASAMLLPDRDVLVRLMEKSGKEPPSEGRSRSRAGALRVSPDLGSVDTLMFFADTEQVSVPAPWGRWALAAPLAPEPVFAVQESGDRLCMGDQSGAHVTCFDVLTGEQTIAWNAPALSVSTDAPEFVAWRETVYTDYGAKLSDDEVSDLIAAVPMPTERPAYSSIHLGPSGELWVRRGPVGEFVDYMVFSRAGKPLGVVHGPPGELLSVGDDYLLSVREDDFGIERLEVHTMKRGASSEFTVRVMAYNIHHGEGMDSVIDLNRIAALIRDVNPELVALQEIDSVVTRTNGVDQAEELGQMTGMTPVFGRFMGYQGGAYGMAVLSKWPIAGAQNIRLPDGDEPRTSVVVDVTSPATGETLRFASIHFYRTEEERMAQAVALVSQLPDDDVPTILAGDYNSTPGSAVMEYFTGDWGIVDKGEDHFTFSSYDPVREIDFVLMRPASRFEVRFQDVLDEPIASDHRPLVVDFTVRN